MKTTLSCWQNFEIEREEIWRFITNTESELNKELIFNSLESLRSELEHLKVCFMYLIQFLNWVLAKADFKALCEHYHFHCFCFQELSIDFEEYSVRADILLEKAEDIQLGPKTQSRLLQQAESSREMITQLQKQLKEKFVPIVSSPFKPVCLLSVTLYGVICIQLNNVFKQTGITKFQ